MCNLSTSFEKGKAPKHRLLTKDLYSNWYVLLEYGDLPNITVGAMKSVASKPQ